MLYYILFLVFILIVILYNSIIEPFYAYLYGKPFYVHFYIYPKRITLAQLYILTNEFEFYKKLNPKSKRHFEHRVASFIEKYPFYGKDGLIITDQMKVLVAATAVMLTFGMRKYLFTLIDKIIIYPDVYYSTINKDYHKGEFNPRMKTVVFSWKHFLEGYEIDNDNLNLGLHEFSHVLHFQGKINKDISASIFTVTFEEILEQVKRPANFKRLVDSNYFRIYAYTNQFEFIAVVLEHFFETPSEFKREFPELFEKVKIMINFSE